MPNQVTPLTQYYPAKLPLEIIYADDDILVLNKPTGLLSVPGKGQHLADCLQARATEQYPTARIVHRLDMHTSGLMIMALHAGAHRNLSAQFEKRAVDKTYEALVWGRVADRSGIIDLPLRCDWERRPLQKVDHTFGKPSQTRYQILEIAQNFTRVALYPKTGRSHQLRVHMLSLGHPILGDEFYAEKAVIELSPRANHALCLHAKELTIEHPITGRPLHFVNLPDF